MARRKEGSGLCSATKRLWVLVCGKDLFQADRRKHSRNGGGDGRKTGN